MIVFEQVHPKLEKGRILGPRFPPFFSGKLRKNAQYSARYSKIRKNIQNLEKILSESSRVLRTGIRNFSFFVKIQKNTLKKQFLEAKSLFLTMVFLPWNPQKTSLEQIWSFWEWSPGLLATDKIIKWIKVNPKITITKITNFCSYPGPSAPVSWGGDKRGSGGHPRRRPRPTSCRLHLRS